MKKKKEKRRKTSKEAKRAIGGLIRAFQSRLDVAEKVVELIRVKLDNLGSFYGNYRDMTDVFIQLRNKDDEYRAELFRQSQRINTLERNLLDPLLKKSLAVRRRKRR